MHFEVVDLLRGGVVPNITNDINLPRGDFFVFEFQFKVSSMICASCPCLVNKDLHPPIHKNIFFQPLLRSGQTLLQRVVWILKLLPTVLSAVVFHILFQVFVLWHWPSWSFSCIGLDVVWSSKKVTLLRGVTTHPIASTYIFKIQIYKFKIYVYDMNRVSTPQRRNIIYWTLPPNMQHHSHVSNCQVRFRGSTMAGLPMARDPNQMCHGGSVGSEEFQN